MPGIRKFTLEAATTGRGDLTFVHGRPWETNAKLEANEDISDIIKKVIPVIVNPRSDENKSHDDQRDKKSDNNQ